jgi:hypothetical protein
MEGKTEFNKIKKSSRSGKKYMVTVKDGDSKKTVHFGDSNMEQYKDSTGLGLYSSKDHGDETRRKSFRSRFQGITQKDGSKAINDKTSPAYWAYRYLW